MTSSLELGTESTLGDEMVCWIGADKPSVVVFGVREGTASNETAGLTLVDFVSGLSYVPMSGRRRIGFGAFFASGTFVSVGLATGAFTSGEVASGLFVPEDFKRGAFTPEDFGRSWMASADGVIVLRVVLVVEDVGGPSLGAVSPLLLPRREGGFRR